jgi:tryptophan 7-halogenase
MSRGVKKVVIVGGGTSGWICAALMSKILGGIIEIELVESEDVGRIGVGEATIPPIRHLNMALGIDEGDFIRETKATIKLAIKFDNWRVEGEHYFHTFGAAGKSSAFCSFHHYWLRSQQLGNPARLWDYDLNYLCASANKFAPINHSIPDVEMLYAYHFDASLYAGFLRRYSEARGVKRTEGFINTVNLDADYGHIVSLELKSGRTIAGDLFIDCSGLRALLIQKSLNTGFDDWSHWLPCDRAVAVPSERLPETLPYTQAIAHKVGWQWRIPLQHRNGNGLVYSSNYCSDDEAASVLLNNLGTRAVGEPNFIKFLTGRRRKQWNRNVIAVGLSSGFLEPLESTSIHLIQSAVVRLIKFFPHLGIDQANVDEYNRQSRVEYEQIRDFIILHYYVNERKDSQFWKDMRHMDVPASLQRKIKVYRATGNLFREQDDLFLDSSWLQVLLGQGIRAKDYHPVANHLRDHQLKDMLEEIRQRNLNILARLPAHDLFLDQVCGGQL